MITKKQFEVYKAARLSGVTNMCHIRLVREVSELIKKQYIEITENYTKLKYRHLNNK